MNCGGPQREDLRTFAEKQPKQHRGHLLFLQVRQGAAVSLGEDASFGPHASARNVLDVRGLFSDEKRDALARHQLEPCEHLPGLQGSSAAHRRVHARVDPLVKATVVSDLARKGVRCSKAIRG